MEAALSSEPPMAPSQREPSAAWRVTRSPGGSSLLGTRPLVTTAAMAMEAPAHVHALTSLTSASKVRERHSRRTASPACKVPNARAIVVARCGGRGLEVEDGTGREREKRGRRGGDSGCGGGMLVPEAEAGGCWVGRRGGGWLPEVEEGGEGR